MRAVSRNAYGLNGFGPLSRPKFELENKRAETAPQSDWKDLNPRGSDSKRALRREMVAAHGEGISQAAKPLSN